MHPRVDRDSEFVIKVAINLASTISLVAAEKLMAESGISETIIERILYDPNNIRESDLDDFLNC